MAQNTDSEAQPQADSGLAPAVELLSEIAACGIVVVASLLPRPLTNALGYFKPSAFSEPPSQPTSPSKDSTYRIKVEHRTSSDDSVGGLDEAEDIVTEDLSASFRGPMLPSRLDNRSLADLTFSFRSQGSHEVENTSFQSQGGRRFRTPVGGQSPPNQNTSEVRHRTPVPPHLTSTGDNENLALSFVGRSPCRQATLAAASKGRPVSPAYIAPQRSADSTLEDYCFGFHAPDDDSVAVSDSASQVVRDEQSLLTQVLWWVQNHISVENRTAVAAYAVRYPDKTAAVIRSSFTNKEELLLASLKLEGMKVDRKK